MLIDDDKSTREMISLVFDQPDYQIKAVADASGIDNLIHRFKPDLVMLGTKNGGEICQRFRLIPAFTQVPIILLSAAVIHEEVPEYGQDLLIAKPFDISYLKSMVELLIRRGTEAP